MTLGCWLQSVGHYISLSEFHYQIDAIEPPCINVQIEQHIKAARFIYLMFIAELKKRLAADCCRAKVTEHKTPLRKPSPPMKSQI